MINANPPVNNVAANFIRFLEGRQAGVALPREIQQPGETLDTALFLEDSRLASYVIRHLPRGSIYTSVNIGTIERSSLGNPTKTYKVISLSLNRAQGIVASLHAVGSGLGIFTYSHLMAPTDEARVTAEIMNGLRGIVPLNSQITKAAAMKFTEIRLFIQQNNPSNVEIKLIDKGDVLHTFETTCVVGGALKTTVVVLGVFAQICILFG